MIRAFIAIELRDQKSIELISKSTERLKKNQKNLKVVEPENLHLTLKFLGDVVEHDAPNIYRVVERLNKQFFDEQSVQYRLNGIGQFNKYSVIWVNLLGDIKFLQDVKDALENALYNEIKIPKDERSKFKPHLTVARLKKNKIDYKTFNAFKKFFGENKELDLGEFNMSGMKLKKSDLTPQGPIYTDLVY